MSEEDPATGALWELGGPQDEVLSGGRSDLGDIPDDTPTLCTGHQVKALFKVCIKGFSQQF